MKINKDDLSCLYGGLAFGVGILGFIVVAAITHALMPTWANVSEFANFLMICGWASVVVVYATLYIFTAVYCGWPIVKKVIIGEED
jgi:hypothetical protein